MRVAVLAVGIRMRYLAISGEDSSTYLLVCDKSCFVHSKSVHVLLAQARPAMINHHTSSIVVIAARPHELQGKSPGPHKKPTFSTNSGLN